MAISPGSNEDFLIAILALECGSLSAAQFKQAVECNVGGGVGCIQHLVETKNLSDEQATSLLNRLHQWRRARAPDPLSFDEFSPRMLAELICETIGAGAILRQPDQSFAEPAAKGLSNNLLKAVLAAADDLSTNDGDADLNPAVAKQQPIHRVPDVGDASSSEKQRSSRQDYELVRVVGQGGLGRVWLARDKRLDRFVAVKELRRDRAGLPRHRERFLREAAIGGRLQHPNIVPLFHLGVDSDDEPFIVMNFVGGETLDAKIRTTADLRRDWVAHRGELCLALTAFLKICDAVAYAHSHGVIHRDLKPNNVMLGEFGEVLVLDWGLAKIVNDCAADSGAESPIGEHPDDATADAQNLTAAGAILGSFDYMAPEQAGSRLHKVGKRTDVYGLGAILYAIITGRPPRKASTENFTDAVRRIERVPPPTARAVNPSTPRSLDAICARAMALKPDDRYATATQLGDDIRNWLADEPVAAYRESWHRRLAREAVRRRTVASVGALTAFSLLLIFVVVQTHQYATNQSLASQQLQQTRDSFRELLSALHREVRQFAAQMHLVASLPSINDVLSGQPNETETLRAQRVLAAWSRLEPSFVQAIVVDTNGVPRTRHRRENMTGRPSLPESVLVGAAMEVLREIDKIRPDQIAFARPLAAVKLERNQRHAAIVSVPVRDEHSAAVIGVLALDTQFGYHGFQEFRVDQDVLTGLGADWFYFEPFGRLVQCAINSGRQIPTETVPRLADVFPELTPLLDAEQFPIEREIPSSKDNLMVFARREKFKEIYPMGSPIFVVSRSNNLAAPSSWLRNWSPALAAFVVVVASALLAILVSTLISKTVQSD